MAEWSDPRATQTGAGVTIDGKPIASTAVDAGLRAHMLKVYNYMASGVLLTGIVAMLFANSGMAAQVMATPLRWLIILSPLAFIMVMSFGMNKLSTGALQAMFWAFATVMGLSMSTIFIAFTGTSIATTFFATAAAFLGLSLYGYTTKKDLSGFGTFVLRDKRERVGRNPKTGVEVPIAPRRVVTFRASQSLRARVAGTGRGTR